MPRCCVGSDLCPASRKIEDAVKANRELTAEIEITFLESRICPIFFVPHPFHLQRKHESANSLSTVGADPAAVPILPTKTCGTGNQRRFASGRVRKARAVHQTRGSRLLGPPRRKRSLARNPFLQTLFSLRSRVGAEVRLPCSMTYARRG